MQEVNFQNGIFFRCFDHKENYYFVNKSFRNREIFFWNFRFPHLLASAGPFKVLWRIITKQIRKINLEMGLLVYANHRLSNNGKSRKFPVLLGYVLMTSWISTSGSDLWVNSCAELTSVVIEVRPDKKRPVIIQSSTVETESAPMADLMLEAFL